MKEVSGVRVASASPAWSAPPPGTCTTPVFPSRP